MSVFIFVFVCAFLAFSLSAVSGGGAGLLLMPVLGIYLPITHVPAALSVGTLTSSASRIAAFFKAIRWSLVKWFVPSAIPAVFIGAWILRFLNPLYLEMMMGIFLISNISFLFRKPAAHNPKKHSTGGILIVGFLAGFLSGLTGAVGLLFNKFYLRFGLTKEEIVATRAANELMLHIIKLALYFSFGLISDKVIGIGLMVALGGLLSSWFMKWGLKWISEIFFRRIGYASMVVSGILMLAQSGDRLLSQNNAYITFNPITEGVESKLQWQDASMSIEFEYDEGFEYERQIDFANLPLEKQLIVNNEKGNADKVIIEEVFGIASHSYEAYFFDAGRLTRKMEL